MPSFQAKKIKQLNCGKCGADIDPEQLAPLSTVDCPECGHEVKVPALIDNYLLLDVIGKGSSGTVFKALDDKLHRQVALKVLAADDEREEELADECVREARALARINHRGIVQIHTIGEFRGQYYIVMELVTGGTAAKKYLGKLSGKADELEILELAITVAEGLNAAHKVGLVHMDVKPSNILLTKEGVPKLIDFGAAMYSASGQAEGTVVGTPYYIAPEVAVGRPGDFKSDMYSLGATLYHLLTGRPPFEGANTGQIIKKRIKEPTPSVRDRRKVHPLTDAVIEQMMQQRPVARYETYDDLIAALMDARDTIVEGGADGASERPDDPMMMAGSIADGRPEDPFDLENAADSLDPVEDMAAATMSSVEGLAEAASGDGDQAATRINLAPTSSSTGSGSYRRTGTMSRSSSFKRKKGPPTALIFGGVAAGVVLLIILAFAFSGGDDPSSNGTDDVPPPPKAVGLPPKSDPIKVTRTRAVMADPSPDRPGTTSDPDPTPTPTPAPAPDTPEPAPDPAPTVTPQQPERVNAIAPALQLDFGETPGSGAHGPAHADKSLKGIDDRWVHIGPADTDKNFVLANGSTADGVSVIFGVGDTKAKRIDWSNKSLAAKSGTSPQTYQDNDVARDYVRTDVDGSLGLRVDGLTEGIYAVFIAAENTYDDTTGENHAPYALYVRAADEDKSGNGTPYDKADRIEIDNKADGFKFGVTYARASVSISDGQSLMIVSERVRPNDNGERVRPNDNGERGQLNLVQILKVAGDPIMTKPSPEPKPSPVPPKVVAGGGTGKILLERWDGLPGANVDIDFLDRGGLETQPTHTQEVNAFQSPRNKNDNYAHRIHGFIHPPITGEYVFQISSDDNGVLYLSRDASSENAQWIAEREEHSGWDEFAAESSPVRLEAGKIYYIMALQKEGTGEDHLRVGWKRPDGVVERPIPGKFLSPAKAWKKPPLPVATMNPAQRGAVLQEIWTGVGGGDVGNGLKAIKGRNRASKHDYLKGEIATDDFGDNYVQRISGYINAPATGDYTFWLSSDDHSELRLSTNDKPKGIRKIVERKRADGKGSWPGEGKSAPIKLVAGERYYFEAIHKEGGGGSHFALGWTLPGGKNERPMKTRHLSPAVPKGYRAPEINSLAFDTLRPAEAVTSAGAALTRDNEGGILADGENAANATYTVTVPVDWERPITAIELDALTHPSMAAPRHGPGRGPAGALVIGEIGVAVTPRNDPTKLEPVKLRSADTDYEETERYGATNLIDGSDKTAWVARRPDAVGQPHRIRLVPESPIQHKGGNLVIRISHQFTFALGYFRLRATTADKLPPMESLTTAPSDDAVAEGDSKSSTPPEPSDYHMHVNCGGGDYVEPNGTIWKKDKGFKKGSWGHEGGENKDHGEVTIPLIKHYRQKMKSYKFTVPNGKYKVRLIFAELHKGTGQRVFSMDVEGKPIRNLDVISHSRSFFKPYPIDLAVEVTDGVLDIEFTKQKDEPFISAISVESMR